VLRHTPGRASVKASQCQRLLRRERQDQRLGDVAVELKVFSFWHVAVPVRDRCSLLEPIMFSLWRQCVTTGWQKALDAYCL
jgi:hypothetical protein